MTTATTSTTSTTTTTITAINGKPPRGFFSNLYNALLIIRFSFSMTTTTATTTETTTTTTTAATVAAAGCQQHGLVGFYFNLFLLH